MALAYLKVKIKSLAAEAKIIRHEELKYLRTARWLGVRAETPPPRLSNSATWLPPRSVYAGLYAHRIEISIEQRAALIAYGYIRGRPYRTIEYAPYYLKAPFCRPGPDWGRIRDLVWKYGPSPDPSVLRDKKTTDKAKDDLWKTIKAWADVPAAQKKVA
mgnify:CR=1 FL=1